MISEMPTMSINFEMFCRCPHCQKLVEIEPDLKELQLFMNIMTVELSYPGTFRHLHVSQDCPNCKQMFMVAGVRRQKVIGQYRKKVRDFMKKHNIKGRSKEN